MPGQGWRIGQRRELLILLPVSILILVALSTFALFAYRNTVELLIEERLSEATRMARKVASELALGPLPDAEELRRRLPTAREVTLLDDRGQLAVTTGARALATPRQRWPGEALPEGEDLISGTARFHKMGRNFTLQVDLPAPILRSRERGLRILTPVLLTMNGMITVFVLVFLQHFLAPFEGLLQRARDAGQEVAESEDEVVFLVNTFEKALAALAVDNGRGHTKEIDELKALESTLARSLESGVLLCDASGGVLALNEIGASLLGVTEPTVGRPLAEALGRHPELTAILERAVRQKREVKRQECTVETVGGRRALGLTAHPLKRDDGTVRGFLILFADLTDAQRETAEIQLADSLSQLGELTAGVAHELRNSLATLRGYLTLVERAPDEESITDYLSEIRHESDHLERVLEDFLTFARPGSARPRELDLAALMYRAAADPALDGAAVTVDTGNEAKTDAFHVQGDAQLLERALRNLLNNAVEAQSASDGPEPVRTRLQRRDQGVEIEIDDHGPGLSAEAQKKLFDPFFTERAGGVGMGLALTRRIVLLHGGRVSLENRKQGGARATLWLPAGKVDTICNNSGF